MVAQDDMKDNSRFIILFNQFFRNTKNTSKNSITQRYLKIALPNSTDYCHARILTMYQPTALNIIWQKYCQNAKKINTFAIKTVFLLSFSCFANDRNYQAVVFGKEQTNVISNFWRYLWKSSLENKRKKNLYHTDPQLQILALLLQCYNQPMHTFNFTKFSESCKSSF